MDLSQTEFSIRLDEELRNQGYGEFYMEGLSTVVVKKSELMASIKTNRENHRELFLEAQKIYREMVIVELDKMLAEARSGKTIRKQVQLIEPKDHTKDYDRVIKMLEMSVDDEIEITQSEFAQFVLDDWSWKEQFLSVSNSYVNSSR